MIFPFEETFKPDVSAKVPAGGKKVLSLEHCWSGLVEFPQEDKTMTRPVAAIRILAPEPPSVPVPPPGKPAPPVKEPMPDKQGSDEPAPDPGEDEIPPEAAP
ncbi:hypothetical protein EV281_103894 [Rhizobium sp. BK418]|nr:hypothetical protein EV281_103894 [Rhizobium sp. BK418]